MTYGLEYEHDDGPWDVPMNYKKWNGLLRYTLPLGDGQLGLTAMGYSGEWNSHRPDCRSAQWMTA